MRGAGNTAAASELTGEPPPSTCLHDGPFDLASGRISVTDAAGVPAVLKSIPAGSYRARLCVDRADHPQHASLYLVPTSLPESLYARSPLLQSLVDAGQSVAEFNRVHRGYRYRRHPSYWWSLLPIGLALIALLVLSLSTR